MQYLLFDLKQDNSEDFMDENIDKECCNKVHKLFWKSLSLIKLPDSSEDLEVEDDEGDDRESARKHEAGPVDIVSDIVDIWYMIYMM